MKTIEIENFRLKIGEATIELTLDEIKALKNKLDEVFPNEAIIPYYPVVPMPGNPYWYPNVIYYNNDIITTGEGIVYSEV